MFPLTISEKQNVIINKVAYWLVWVILAIGIVLRLVIYFQGRNLTIDEANIVRNIHEKSFADLAKPLNYLTFAPPVFLWIEKIVSIFWNYGEKAMKFFPLLCGISSLLVFRNIMRRFISDPALIFPMALVSWTYLLVNYSAEVKQYMPDTLIALLLVLFALKNDVLGAKKWKFILFWAIAGSVAIWASMPSVFILAAVGLYYGWVVFRSREWTYSWRLGIIAAIWLVQFGIYYVLVLKSQIGIDILQKFHSEYFLYGITANEDQWRHNWERIRAIFYNTGGFSDFNLQITVSLIIIGIITMIRTNFKLFILIAGPIIFTFIAAAYHQFSLIDRVILYLQPLIVIIIGYGIGRMMKLRFFVVHIALLWLGTLAISKFNQFHVINEFQGLHEITESFEYLKSHHARGKQLYISQASDATYIYYTQLHPDKQKWSSLAGARLLNWSDDYADVTRNVTDTAYFVYTGGFGKDERDQRTAEIEKNLKQVDYFEKYISYTFMYVPKVKE